MGSFSARCEIYCGSQVTEGFGQLSQAGRGPSAVLGGFPRRTWEVWRGNNPGSSSTLPPGAAKPMATWLSKKISHPPWNPTSAVLLRMQPRHPHPTPENVCNWKTGCLCSVSLFWRGLGRGRLRMGQRVSRDAELEMGQDVGKSSVDVGAVEPGCGVSKEDETTKAQWHACRDSLAWAPWMLFCPGGSASEERLVETG